MRSVSVGIGRVSRKRTRNSAGFEMGDECAMNDLWGMSASEAALTICRAALEAVDA